MKLLTFLIAADRGSPGMPGTKGESGERGSRGSAGVCQSCTTWIKWCFMPRHLQPFTHVHVYIHFFPDSYAVTVTFDLWHWHLIILFSVQVTTVKNKHNLKKPQKADLKCHVQETKNMFFEATVTVTVTLTFDLWPLTFDIWPTKSYQLISESKVTVVPHLDDSWGSLKTTQCHLWVKLNVCAKFEIPYGSSYITFTTTWGHCDHWYWPLTYNHQNRIS